MLGPSAATPTAPQSMVTFAAHYDPLNLIAPPAPTQPPLSAPSVIPVQLNPGGSVPGLSAPVSGNFMGFSIELSVADQIMGRSGKFIDPVFLNLLSNINVRGGSVLIRVGGNSQEKAVFHPEGLPNGATILKNKGNATDPTFTPTIDVGIDLLYAMANISSLTNAKWFVGVPFNDTANPRLAIASYAQQILGDHLLGFQVGNEPDLYGDHGARPTTYSVNDYIDEYQAMIYAMGNDTGITNKKSVIGPSVCCKWSLDDVIGAGYSKFLDVMAYISAEHYITNNCKVNGNIQQPQDMLPIYLSHNNVINLVQPFLNDSAWAQANNKPYIMMETNTASCGGFPGVSDTLGAVLWGVDYSLKMAESNFSAAMFHNGGQNTYYNSFTPPPRSAAKRGKKWTVSSMFYSALIVSEALGSSGDARIADLQLNGGSDSTPGYVIYENDVPVRMVLLNYVTDPSGASNYTVQIDMSALGGGNSIMARYFTGGSVTDKAPFYYANQTFGPPLQSDGTLQGTRSTISIPCSSPPQQNTCNVSIPAPGLAVLFLNPESSQSSDKILNDNNLAVTFATTATTVSVRMTATINPSVLATSNGYGGMNRQMGSTSFGSLTTSNGAMAVSGHASASVVTGVVGVAVWVIVGAFLAL